MPATMRFASETVVPLPPDKAWEVFSDTDHFNRYVGLPRVTYDPPAPGAGPYVRQASARMLGLALRWSEYPFEWIEGKHFRVRRIYQTGPAREVIGGIEMEPAAGGTRLRFVVEMQPRSAFVAPICMLLAKRTLRGFVGYCEGLLRRCAMSGAATAGPAHAGQPVDERRLREAIDATLQSHPVHEALLSKFEEHVREAGDDHVLRMRPYELAEQWSEDKHETLSLFLHATRSGALALEWQLMCPNCRVPKGRASSFASVAMKYHCDLCGIDYDTDLERYTELRFSVSPEIRQAEDAVYCIGSPARTPHVVAQCFLAPGEGRRFTTTLGTEVYRARVLGANVSQRVEPESDPLARGTAARALTLAIGPGGWVTGGANTFAPGFVDLELRNDTAQPALVVLERVEWDRFAVTAAEVTTLQEFRALFSGEVLAPGQQIGVRSLAILFTDLKRSTELYEQVGDAAAYGRVHRHFDFIAERVAAARGAVVKTIGDAVMAVFPSRLAAARAALAMQRQIDAFNLAHGIEPGLVLKMGVHAGPAIVVNANGMLDYFGRTVNLAARVQAESAGADIVLSDEVAADPEVRALLGGGGEVATPYEARLRGFAERMRLWRVEPSSAAKARVG